MSIVEWLSNWQATLAKHVLLQCLEGPLQQQDDGLAGTKQWRRALCGHSMLPRTNCSIMQKSS